MLPCVLSMLLISVVASLTLVPSPAWGASPPLMMMVPHFVSPLGTDKGTCTAPSTPCASVDYAFHLTSPGDVIYVAAGSYGAVTLANHSGLYLHPISIVGGGASTFASFLLANVSNVVVDGVTTRGSRVAAVTLSHSSSIVISNSAFLSSQSYGLTGQNISHLTLVNVTIDSAGNHGIYLGGPQTSVQLLHSKVYNSSKIGVHLDPYILLSVIPCRPVCGRRGSHAFDGCPHRGQLVQ